jgi:hypothetical protein
MLSPGQTKRISRIRRRASPEVREAYENGLISAKRADLLLYKSHSEQAAELERRFAEIAEREQKHATVARTIREYLDGLGAERKVDLIELSKLIKEAMK